MTNDLTELRTAMYDARRAKLDLARAAVVEVPLSPQRTYRPRVLSKLTEVAGDLTEKDFFQAWNHDPELSRFVTILHTMFCNTPLSRVNIRYEDEQAR